MALQAKDTDHGQQTARSWEAGNRSSLTALRTVHPLWSRLPASETMHFYCLSHSGCGTSLPQQTNTHNHQAHGSSCGPTTGHPLSSSSWALVSWLWGGDNSPDSWVNECVWAPSTLPSTSKPEKRRGRASTRWPTPVQLPREEEESPPWGGSDAGLAARLKQEKPFLSVSLLCWPAPSLPVVNKNTQGEMRTHSSTFLARHWAA